MYCVAYLFSVNSELPDAEKRFVACWTALTKFFQDEAGCGPSRLVRTGEGMYCAYSHWSSLELHVASREKPPKEDFMSHRLDWAELVEHTEIVFEGEMVAEL